MARARRAGLVVTPRQVFEHKTPAGLAAAVTAPASAPAQDTGAAGVVPVTPAMARLASRGGPVGRFCQWAVIAVPPGAGLERLTAAVGAVADRHDVLRARLEQPPGQPWQLVIPEPGTGTDLGAGWVRRVGAAGLNEDGLAREAQQQGRAAAGRLDPAAGVMVQAVWLDAGPDVAGRLVVVIHHLVVDGVSWRVLVPDLAAAWQVAAAGAGPVLEPVPASFRGWALWLAGRAADPQVTAELPVWAAVLDGAARRWPAGAWTRPATRWPRCGVCQRTCPRT